VNAKDTVDPLFSACRHRHRGPTHAIARTRDVGDHDVRCPELTMSISDLDDLLNSWIVVEQNISAAVHLNVDKTRRNGLAVKVDLLNASLKTIVMHDSLDITVRNDDCVP
jgi:hypothetical protein